MTYKADMPHFQSEAEEAAWWDQHRGQTAAWMEEAIVSGKTTNLAAVLDRRQNSNSDSNISLKINSEDLELARSQAAQRGLSYQAYLEMLIHNALTQPDHTT